MGRWTYRRCSLLSLRAGSSWEGRTSCSQTLSWIVFRTPPQQFFVQHHAKRESELPRACKSLFHHRHTSNLPFWCWRSNLVVLTPATILLIFWRSMTLPSWAHANFLNVRMLASPVHCLFPVACALTPRPHYKSALAPSPFIPEILMPWPIGCQF